MNLLKMTIDKLACLREQVTNKISRRTEAAVDGHDPASIIYGNETAKRALIVAAAGNHSILFVGPPNCGKTMLRAAAFELELTDTHEARPCPCGWRTHRNKPCNCTIRQIERHIAKYPATDITVELLQPQECERAIPSTNLDDMKKQIADATDHENIELGEHESWLLNSAVKEMAIDEANYQRIVQVARTIANLDRSERIGAAHIAEAINYRSFRR